MRYFCCSINFHVPRMPKDPSGRVCGTSTLPHFPREQPARHSLCQLLDGREGGGPLETERLLWNRFPQGQHLCGGLHHLLGTSATLRSFRTPGWTRALLRHRLRYLHTSLRSNVPSPRRLPGRFQERTRVGRCHRGILLRRTKELGVPDARRKNRLQGPWFLP